MIHDPHGVRRFNISLDLAGDPYNTNTRSLSSYDRVPRNGPYRNSRDEPILPGNQEFPVADQNTETSGCKRSSRKKLPNNKMAALAMVLSGFTDLQLIADSTGLTLREVQEIEGANDPRVQRFINEGLPAGELYRLRNAVKCPTCAGRVYLVPCVLCTNQI